MSACNLKGALTLDLRLIPCVKCTLYLCNERQQQYRWGEVVRRNTAKDRRQTVPKTEKTEGETQADKERQKETGITVWQDAKISLVPASQM